MKNIFLAVLVSFCTFIVLTGCSTAIFSARNEPLLSDKEVIAIVNGNAITEEAIKRLKTEAAMYNKRIKVSQEQLINELINRELLYQQALKHQLDEQPLVIDRIEAARRSVLFQSEMKDFMDKTDITHTALQAEYDRQSEKAAPDLVEYKTSHILTKTEGEAKKIIARLNKGQKFAKLAKKFSTDSSAAKGGQLGWLGFKQMVPGLPEAIKLLKNGEYTRKPVSSAHGWHILLLEESRQRKFPPLATVEAALETRMKRIKLQEYIEDLKQNSEIIRKKQAVAKAEAKNQEIMER